MFVMSAGTAARHNKKNKTGTASSGRTNKSKLLRFIIMSSVVARTNKQFIVYPGGPTAMDKTNYISTINKSSSVCHCLFSVILLLFVRCPLIVRYCPLIVCYCPLMGLLRVTL